MLRHSLKIRARVSGKVALFTAAMLVVTSVAQYALDSNFHSGHSQSTQANSNPARATETDSRESVTAEVPGNSVRGSNVSLMIFRTN
jgi:hypothetical protein